MPMSDIYKMLPIQFNRTCLEKAKTKEKNKTTIIFCEHQ